MNSISITIPIKIPRRKSKRKYKSVVKHGVRQNGIYTVFKGLSFQDIKKGGGALLFEILSTASLVSISFSTYFFQNKRMGNDHEKIIQIADAAGLYVKENNTKKSIRIYRKTKKDNYTEYVYKIPLGLSFKDFEEKKHLFEDGLNNKSRLDFNLKALKNIDWNGNVFEQLKAILNSRTKLDKHIELEYDGMLIFRVFDKGLERLYLYDDDIVQKVKNWEVPIGYSYKDFIKHDFEKSQMLVVAGMTRYGKTVFLKNIITTLIHNNPDDVMLTLIDLKGGLAFNRFARCKQVYRVAKNADETIRVLEEIHSDMLKRQNEFLEQGYEDISEAGYKKRHFVIIDEGAEIAHFSDKKIKERCTELVGEIARIGAGLGYRLVFATQYPTADVFPRQVKANTSAALCFRLKNATQSMVVLDEAGAEKLPLKLWGRAIYQTDHNIIVQTPLITNKYIDKKIKIHIRAKGDLNASTQSKKPGKTGSDIIKFEEVRLSH